MAEQERAGRWLRVSTGGQDERNQEPDIDRWIDSHGYHPVKDYTLHGKSAYKGRQDKLLDQVIADMQDGVITALIVWQSGRIERRGAYSVFDLAARVHRAGGRIEYAAPGDQHLNATNDMSDVALALAAWKDHKESQDKAERIRIAQEHIRSNKALLGKLPYGYRAAGPKYGKYPVVCEAEARVIREAVDRYLNQGESLDDICADFNRRKVPQPGRGKSWIPSTLGRLLRNPSLAGRQMSNRDGKGEREVVLRFEEIAIITWPEHEQIVARMNSRAYRRGISPANSFMLTGLVKDEAGHPMWAKLSRYNYRYACRKGCGISIGVEDADAKVAREITEIYGQEPHMVRKLVPGENYLDQIARKRQDIRELDPEADSYDARLAELRGELAHLRSLPSKPDHVEWVRSGKTVAQHWDSLDTAGRRDWLRQEGYHWVVRQLPDGTKELVPGWEEHEVPWMRVP